MGDLEVLEYLFNSMNSAYAKLEIALKNNDENSVASIKKLILDINKKVMEELK